MKTQKMTVKEIVNTIPARLGLNENQLDLSTPEKAYEFLRDPEFQIFAQSDNSNHIFDCAPCSLVILETGYKSMYDANNLFAAESPKIEELQKKYGVTESWVADFAVDDEDGYLEYATWPEENLHFVSDNNWPFRLGFGEFGKFDEFVELVRKICVTNNDWAKISVVISDETYNSIDISAEGTIVNSLEYKIIDNNGCAFAYNLAFLLEAFCCDTYEAFDKYAPKIIFEEAEEKNVIPSDCGLIYRFLHKEELANEYDVSKAIELIKKYPLLVKSFPSEIQKNKEVAIAFIKANDFYEQENRKILSGSYVGRHTMLSGAYSRGKIAHLKLNGLISPHGIGVCCDGINQEVLDVWFADIDIVEKFVNSYMSGWVELSDSMFEKIDHKRFLEQYPQYIYVLQRYFISKAENDSKLVEHIKRRFGLVNDVENHAVAVMATYEMIMTYDEKFTAKLIDSYNSFVLAPYIKELLISAPKKLRDEIIKSNIKTAYYISDELENDEEIVDYICKNCPKAGDILSDEIVLKRGLKRTTLDEEEICCGCEYC